FLLFLLFFFYFVCVYRFLYSFPTRRSSDLKEMNLPELIEWGFKNDIREKSFIVYECVEDQRHEVHFNASGIPKFSDALKCTSCLDRKSTRLNSSHVSISYAVFCLKKKNKIY